jgi:hypothetical protein
MTELEKNETAVKTSVKNTLFILSLIFSLGPLVVGVSIFFLWWLTRFGIFEFLGFLTVLGGLVSVFLAFILAIGYTVEAFKARESAVKVTMRVLFVLTAIAVNFPAAWACLAGRHYIDSFYILTIDNKSSETILQVTISGCGINKSIGPILPNSKNSIKFHVVTDGQLTFSVNSSNFKIDGLLEEHMTPHSDGAERTLIIKNDGKYVIEGEGIFKD